MSSAQYKLDHLTLLVDHNGLQIDGTNDEVMKVNPIEDKFRAFGWNVISIHGHDYDEIRSALMLAKKTKGRPTAIVAETIKGKGVAFMENQVGWHGKAPSPEQCAEAVNALEGVD